MKFVKGKMYSIKLDNKFWCIGRHKEVKVIFNTNNDYFDVIVDMKGNWVPDTFSITSQRDYEIEEVTKETHPEYFL